jgi:hypothetical protein
MTAKLFIWCWSEIGKMDVGVCVYCWLFIPEVSHLWIQPTQDRKYSGSQAPVAHAIILATQEAEIRWIMLQSQPSK